MKKGGRTQQPDKRDANLFHVFVRLCEVPSVHLPQRVEHGGCDAAVPESLSSTVCNEMAHLVQEGGSLTWGRRVGDEN